MENRTITNLCSCIVHTRPENGPEVEKRLNSIPGVEVHGGVDEGKLIVTVEELRWRHHDEFQLTRRCSECNLDLPLRWG